MAAAEIGAFSTRLPLHPHPAADGCGARSARGAGRCRGAGRPEPIVSAARRRRSTRAPAHLSAARSSLALAERRAVRACGRHGGRDRPATRRLAQIREGMKSRLHASTGGGVAGRRGSSVRPAPLFSMRPTAGTGSAVRTGRARAIFPSSPRAANRGRRTILEAYRVHIANLACPQDTQTRLAMKGPERCGRTHHPKTDVVVPVVRVVPVAVG